MKNAVRMVFVLLAAAPLILSGCAGIGPTTVDRDRFDYTVAIGDSWKSQMLLNMVKMRYGDAPIFLDVASVISQYEIQGTVDLGATLSSSPYSAGQTIGAHGTYADRPTITYSPLTGEKFAKSLMTPISPSTILNLVQTGNPIDLVFRLCVSSINGIRNRYGGRARAHSADPEFYPLLEKMKGIQATEGIGMRVKKIDDREAIVLIFRGKVDPATEAASADVRRVLGLDPATREFKVVYDSVATGDKEIAILSRSLLEIIVDLASNIEVPDVHVTEKRVSPAFKDEPTVGVTVPPLFRVLSSPQRSC